MIGLMFVGECMVGVLFWGDILVGGSYFGKTYFGREQEGWPMEEHPRYFTSFSQPFKN